MLPRMLWILLFGATAFADTRPVATTATYRARITTADRPGGPPAGLQIQLDGNGIFPAGARDPVLHVGAAVLRTYRYVGEGNRALVFFVPPEVTLDNGAPMYLQYEPGQQLRIDLPPFDAAAVTR